MVLSINMLMKIANIYPAYSVLCFLLKYFKSSQ